MTLLQRIIIDPEICLGKPCIRGSRITVESILELLAAGWSYSELQDEFQIEKDDIFAVLEYAKRIIEEERVYKLFSEASV
jgi:uncharacterized protein (DUF433 family)